VRLARSRWPEQDDVLLRVQEVELPQVFDDRFLDRALVAEVELLEGLARRKRAA
jgi:hypothetical protein